MPDELRGWLDKVGLGAHAATLAAQGVDWDVLGDLSDEDLRELGLPLGDRKRLLKALTALEDDAASSGQPLAQGAAAPLAASEAERRQLSVMFIDLIDSTLLAERFDPEELRQVLRLFHEACEHAIRAHEGHIAQYQGDGLLVYFGYPQAHEDDAVRAALAGLDLIANLRRANDRLEAENNVRLKVRVAIETGLVVAGEVGAGASLDPRAIVGEAPIVAARLQTLAPPDSVVIGPATERLIQGSFDLEDLGSHALKGISGTSQVWRLLSRTDAGSFDIRAGRGLTPLVGRAAELEMLKQRWSQSCDGEMRCVMLVGEAGIGKSRTLRAFHDCVADGEHALISFDCSSYYRDSPFWPVLRRLQRSFSLDPRAPTEADVGRLEAALADFSIDAEEAGQVLANLLELPATGRYQKIDTSHTAFKQRCLTVLVDLVEDLSRRQPVLLMVEDAHWIDPSTLDLVRSLLERLTSSRLMLVITARPEFKPEWHYPHLVQLNLDRLSRRDRLAMIERLTGGKPMPTVVLDQIVAKTDGVPLFVEELTKTILQGGLLRDTGVRYEVNGPLPAIAIPDTLQSSLLSRLDRLAPGVKEIAQIASTIGREFSEGLLALIASRPEGEVRRTLDRLVEEDIILPATGAAPPGGAFLFRHALIHETAYHSMLVTRRRQFHGRIAQALESNYPEVVERQPELIAQNLASSDRPRQAIPYWQLAGDRALARAAFQEAIAHADAGLALAESVDATERERALLMIPLLLARGAAEFRVGDRRSVATYRQAAKLARAHHLPSELAQAALGFDDAGQYLEASGAAAVGLMEEALAAIGPEASLDRCRLLSRLTNSLHMTGASERAREIAGEALGLARNLDDGVSILYVLMCELMHVGAAPLAAKQFADRARLLAEIEEVADRVGTAAGQESVRAQIGRARALAAHLEIGDYRGFAAARAKLQEGAEAQRELVYKWIGISAAVMEAILIGDFPAAESSADESICLAGRVDADLPTGAYGMQMFTIRREQGRLAEVAPVIKRLVDDNPEDSAWRPGLMLIASDLGFDGAALTNLERLAENGFPIPEDSKRLATLTYVAEVAARVGNRSYTEQIYERLLPFRDQAVTVPTVTLCLGSAARYCGLLAGSLGDWSAAEAHFEYALDMNERLHARPWLAHAQHDFAVVLSARNRKGDRKRAAGLLASAAATARELNMFALLERVGGPSSASAAEA